MASEARVSGQFIRTITTKVAANITIEDSTSEAFVVNGLDALRVVGHAEARVRTAPGIVEFQRQRLERAVEIGPEFQERLQADMNEKVVRNEVDQAAEETDQNHGDAEPEDHGGRLSLAEPILQKLARVGRSRRFVEHAINDEFEGPGLEEIEADVGQSECHATCCCPKEGPEITNRPRVDIH